MKNKNVINEFLDSCPNCPICGSALTFGAFSFLDSAEFGVKKNESGLMLTAKTDFFVEKPGEEFIFDIELRDGTIYTSKTADKFLSMYDLHIIIHKHCQTKLDNYSEFWQGISIRYNLKSKSFIANYDRHHFTVDVKSKIYFLISDQNANVSQLSITNSQSESHKRIWIQINKYIDFNELNFSDKNQLTEKLQTIQLIA